MEHSHNLSFEVTDIAPEEMRGKLRHQQGFQPSFDSNSKHVDLASICNPVSEQKGKEFENHSDIEGVSIGVLADLGGPSDVQESCSIDSGLNEVSLEATSFRQLQQVMEQVLCCYVCEYVHKSLNICFCSVPVCKLVLQSYLALYASPACMNYYTSLKPYTSSWYLCTPNLFFLNLFV